MLGLDDIEFIKKEGENQTRLLINNNNVVNKDQDTMKVDAVNQPCLT